MSPNQAKVVTFLGRYVGTVRENGFRWTKAAMVSNLLIVLCGDSRTQPVINTGTLYQ